MLRKASCATYRRHNIASSANFRLKNVEAQSIKCGRAVAHAVHANSKQEYQILNNAPK